MIYLITPPGLYEEPLVDDFPGEQSPVSEDSDEPWTPECDTNDESPERHCGKTSVRY